MLNSDASEQREALTFGEHREEEVMTGENQAETPVWIVSPNDPTMVRLQLPPLPIAGLSKPLDLHIDFDVTALDETIARLIELRDLIRRHPRLRH